MSSGCSSSCWTAPFHRYTERQARMLTQAARRCSITRSAIFSAAARSGRLVSTSRVRMFQPFEDGRIAKLHAQDPFRAGVVELTGFGHEIVLDDGRARRARQSCTVGDKIEPVAHLHARVIAGVVDARRSIVLERATHDRRE